MSQAPSMYQLRCHALLNAMPTPSTVRGFACQAAALGVPQGCTTTSCRARGHNWPSVDSMALKQRWFS
jgi:hypothetical protein